MALTYLARLAWGTTRAVFWPPAPWERVVRVALFVAALGLGLSPETRERIEMALSEIGVQIEGWQYLLAVAIILILGLAFRIAYQEVSPLRFEPLPEPPIGKRSPADVLYSDPKSPGQSRLIFLPVRNIAYGEAHCVASLCLLDGLGRRISDARFPVTLKTKARFDRGDHYVGPFTLRSEPKPLLICQTSKGGIRVEHENGEAILLRAHYIFEVSVDTGQATARATLSLVPFQDMGFLVSDGIKGYDL